MLILSFISGLWFLVTLYHLLKLRKVTLDNLEDINLHRNKNLRTKIINEVKSYYIQMIISFLLCILFFALSL